MNKEQQELLDEVYETYTNYPLATIQDHHTKILYQNLYKGWCIRIGRSIVSPHPTRHLTKEEFINKCKTDTEFSERWGLKIDERELSLEERIRIYALKEGQTYEEFVTNWNTDEQWLEDLSDTTIPTKLITVTYKNKTIESYE